MNESLIRSGLKSPDRFALHIFEEIDSTNLYLMDLGKKDALEWTVAIAEKQTRGRGRLDRHWASPAGVGLWFSILLRPEIKADDSHLVNLLSAVSLADYLERQVREKIGEDINIGLKWPNDLFINDRKLSGILLQSSVTASKIHYLVMGIGLNVNQTDANFPDEIREKAVSLRMATYHEWNREELLAGFLETFYENYYRFLPQNKKEIVEFYLEKVLYMEENITIRSNGETIEGIFKGLTPQGYLILKRGEKERIITTGEIS